MSRQVSEWQIGTWRRLSTPPLHLPLEFHTSDTSDISDTFPISLSFVIWRGCKWQSSQSPECFPVLILIFFCGRPQWLLVRKLTCRLRWVRSCYGWLMCCSLNWSVVTSEHPLIYFCSCSSFTLTIFEILSYKMTSSHMKDCTFYKNEQAMRVMSFITIIIRTSVSKCPHSNVTLVFCETKSVSTYWLK